MIIKTGNSQGIPVSIEGYQFNNFIEPKSEQGKIQGFTFKKIDRSFIEKKEVIAAEIKRERTFAEDNSFIVDDTVALHRGMKKQAEEEREKRIQEEISARVKTMQDQAYKDGFAQGKKEAKEEALAFFKNEAQQKLDILGELIERLIRNEEQILTKQREHVYLLLKTLTKWIILRELKEDGEYVIRLLEKLILELGTTENLLIKVNKDSFAQMPVVLDLLQRKLGEFKNIRVEINQEQENPGLIIEATNTIIDGSFNEQMQSLEKLFAVVEKHEQ